MFTLLVEFGIGNRFCGWEIHEMGLTWNEREWKTGFGDEIVMESYDLFMESYEVMIWV